MTPTFTRLNGSDYLGTIPLRRDPALDERILATFNISPSAFMGTRLTQLSQLWERYRMTSFRIRYVPAIPTTVACQILLYMDTDPSDDPLDASSVDVLIRQGTAQAGAQQWNAFTPRTIELAIRGDDQLYYTGNDKQNERFSLQGKAYLIQVTNPVNFNGEPIASDLPAAGALYIDWDILFQIPQINPAGFDSLINTVTAPLTLAGAPQSLRIFGLAKFGRYTVVPNVPFYDITPAGGVIASWTFRKSIESDSPLLVAKSIAFSQSSAGLVFVNNSGNNEVAVNVSANEQGEIFVVTTSNTAFVTDVIINLFPINGTPSIIVAPLIEAFKNEPSTPALTTYSRPETVDLGEFELQSDLSTTDAGSIPNICIYHTMPTNITPDPHTDQTT